MNVVMYDSNNITKYSMNILINKSKSLNIKFNNDSNVTQNEGIIIGDFDINDDVNRLNTHIDQFVKAENMYRLKIKEIVNDIIKAQKSMSMI